jgi:hypothetical protein
MVFVVGCHRSGTNWIQRILAAHPDVASVRSETFLFSQGIAGLRERVQHASVGSWQLGAVYMERDAFLDAVRDLCDAMFGGLLDASGTGATRLVERTPEHVHHLDLISDVYPDAWVIHIIRDGRDVARSIASMEWGPSTVGDAAAMWRDAVTAGRDASTRVDRYREVRYEHLLHEPAAVVADLFRWIGVDASDEVVAAAVAESGVPYNVDPSKPVVGSGKWRDDFAPADLAAVEATAGELLADLGYARDRELVGASTRIGSSGGGRARPSRAAPRAGVQRAIGRLRRARPSATGAIQTLRFAAPVVDQLLEAIAERRRDAAAQLLTSGAEVRVVSAEDDWRGRSEEAHARFLDVVFADDLLRGRQTRSDVHPSIPAFTVVTSYETPDGRAGDRVFVVRVTAEQIDSVTYYAFPLR